MLERKVLFNKESDPFSNISDYLDHPAYRQLIALGAPSIPLIIQHYRRDDLPWGFVLQEITGIKMIQDLHNYSPSVVRQRWLEWWEKKHNGE